MSKKEEFTRWDEDEVVGYLMAEPWMLDIAENPDRSDAEYERVIYGFIEKYWLLTPSEVFPQDMAELLAIARKHKEQILAAKAMFRL